MGINVSNGKARNHVHDALEDIALGLSGVEKEADATAAMLGLGPLPVRTEEHKLDKRILLAEIRLGQLGLLRERLANLQDMMVSVVREVQRL